jgi:hypothetical protein
MSDKFKINKKRESYEQARVFSENIEFLKNEIISCLESHDCSFSYFSELCFLLVEKEEPGISFLLELCNEKKLRPIYMRAILSAFSNKKITKSKYSDAIFEKLCFFFENPTNNLIHAESIDGLSNFNFSEEKVLALINHKSPYVVGAALRFLQKKKYSEIFSILVEKLSSPSWIIMSNAIDELEEIGDKNAIPYIQPYLRDRRKSVRKAAKFAINSLKEQAL